MFNLLLVSTWKASGFHIVALVAEKKLADLTGWVVSSSCHWAQSLIWFQWDIGVLGF